MSIKRIISTLLSLYAVLMLSACAKNPPLPSLIEERQTLSILVIPPNNQSVEVNAPYTLASSISRPLAEKGYYVFPVAMVDTMFKENGLPTTAEMNSIPLDKIKEIINPDAVLYINIDRWGQEYQVISSKTVVSSTWRLIDASDGQLLWSGIASAVQSSGDGGGGLAGALIGALVNQIAGSISDNTPQLAQQANYSLINSRHYGLPPGPYFPKPEEQK